MRGSLTQRRKRNISQPTPIPQISSPVTIAPKAMAARSRENAPVLTAATANR